MRHRHRQRDTEEFPMSIDIHVINEHHCSDGSKLSLHTDNERLWIIHTSTQKPDEPVSTALGKITPLAADTLFHKRILELDAAK